MQQQQPAFKNIIYCIVAFAVISSALIALAAGWLSWRDFLRQIGLFSIIAFSTWALWELIRRYFWKTKFFPRAFCDCVDISGDWVGFIESSHVNTNSTPIPIEVCITQTLTSVNVKFVVARSSVSHSVVAAFVTDGESGRCRLIYTYVNEPSAAKSELDMHFGTAILEIEGNPGNRMHGNYLTSRQVQTKGVIDLRRKGMLREKVEPVEPTKADGKRGTEKDVTSRHSGYKRGHSRMALT